MLSTAVRLQPSRADAHNLLGLALAATGRTAEAIDQFGSALRFRADYPAARFNLANSLVKADRLDDAIAEYRQVLVALPADSQAAERLAEVLEARAKQLISEEEWDDAAVRYRELMKLKPDDARIREQYERVLQRQRR